MCKDKYLQDIPEETSNYGFQKVLLVRREIIHLKHIKKEVFQTKSVDIRKYLKLLKMSLFDYIEHLSQRERLIFHINRDYKLQNINYVVSLGESYSQCLKLYSNLKDWEILVNKDSEILVNPWIENYKEVDSISDIRFSLRKNKAVIFISSDKEQLTLAWLLGAKTFYSNGQRLNHFSLKTL